MAVTVPYFAFREVLSVRDSDAAKYRSLSDLAGRRVATLAGTIAYDILLTGEEDYASHSPDLNEDDVHPDSDLVLGRVDAVLLDNVLAERRRCQFLGMIIHPSASRPATMSVSFRRTNTALRDRANEILRQAMGDGTLEPVSKWQVWNADQAPLDQQVLAGDTPPSPLHPRANQRERGDVALAVEGNPSRICPRRRGIVATILLSAPVDGALL